ncbi:serine O-acetyltransferase [Silvibacterium sp.]|uniref:serine O-acetyltransferase n=1 Tax=Silvibacterium sp. TaxID=1964179 RepID=UPI0039E52201
MSLLASIREDIESVMARDPAARSRAMVLLCYPGLWAVWLHRISHNLWVAGWPLAARVLSQCVRFLTGIEIHPGATLGRRLLIDHGMGVVIGETAVVGDDVTLYQGVTLGGTGNESGKRHPTLRDGVFVGNNANVLGNITIGENSRVGAGSVVLQDVPPDSTVVGVPAHVIYKDGARVLITDPSQIKDPLSGVIKALGEEVQRLRARVDSLDGQLEHATRELDSVRSFATEEEERQQYRSEVAKGSAYVSMGEGI